MSLVAVLVNVLLLAPLCVLKLIWAEIQEGETAVRIAPGKLDPE